MWVFPPGKNLVFKTYVTLMLTQITSLKSMMYFIAMLSVTHVEIFVKIKVGYLHPGHQLGSYQDRPSPFATYGNQTHTKVTACDWKLENH